MTTPQLRRRYTCKVCGGPAYRRTSVVVGFDEEDADQPLLHGRVEDWRDNPHDVIPADEGELMVARWTPLRKRGDAT